MNLLGHILIVDDEPALRHTLARILQHAGHQVTTAADGQQALDLIASTHFDLVYLDLRLPDCHGLEILKHLQLTHPTLPVVLFTARPDLQSAIEALRQGAVDYLLKPIAPQTLLDRTHTLLRRVYKERRRRQIQAQIQALQAELDALDRDEELPSSGEKPSQPLPPPDRFVSRGTLSLDLHTRRVILPGRVLSLPPTTFDYLLVLARHAPQVVDYQTLVAEAQGYQTHRNEARELAKWHIHHLRQALQGSPEQPPCIVNVRGTGYRLVTD